MPKRKKAIKAALNNRKRKIDPLSVPTDNAQQPIVEDVPDAGENELQVLMDNLANGELFTHELAPNLEAIAYAMPPTITPVQVAHTLEQNAAGFTDLQKKYCAQFVHSLLRAYVEYLPALGVDNDYSVYLKNLAAVVGDETLLNELAVFTQQREQDYQTSLDKVGAQEVEIGFLYSRLNSLYFEIQTQQMHYLRWQEIVTELMLMASSQQFSTHDKNVLLQSIHQLSSQVLMPEDLHQELLDHMALQPSDPPAESQAPNSKEFFIPLFHQIAHGNITTETELSHALEAFVATLELSLVDQFLPMTAYETRSIVWNKQPQYIPNFQQFVDFTQNLTIFIRFTILHDVSLNHTNTPVRSLQRIRRMTTFMEKAVEWAMAHDCLSTAQIINQALLDSHAVLAELNNYDMAKAVMAEHRQAILWEEYDLHRQLDVTGTSYIPSLSTFCQDLLHIYEPSQPIGTQQNAIGRLLKDYQQIATNLLERQKEFAATHFDPHSEMERILWAQDLLIAGDEQHIRAAVEKRLETKQAQAVQLLTQPIPVFHVDVTTAVKDLSAHLLLCHNRLSGFNVDNVQPEKDIAAFIINIAKLDNSFTYARDGMTILRLVRAIAKINRRSYPHYNRDLGKMLNEYKGHLAAGLQGHLSAEVIPAIQQFYVAFYADRTVHQLLGQPSNTFEMFTSEYQTRKTMEDIDHMYEAFSEKKSQAPEPESAPVQQDAQDALLDLLVRRLANERIENVSEAFNIAHGQTQLNLDEGIFPGTWPPYSGDPEAYVELADTIANMNQTGNRSLYDLFNAKSLQADFIAAFPWAAKFETMNALANVVPKENENLLGTERLFTAKIQIQILEYILLSIDVLGKVAGSQGQQVLGNYQIIKKIVEDLGKFADMLEEPTISEELLAKTAQKHVQYYTAFDKKIFSDMQSRNNRRTFELNADVHDFCFLNERYANCLLGQPYAPSLLTPPAATREIPVIKVIPKGKEG